MEHLYCCLAIVTGPANAKQHPMPLMMIRFRGKKKICEISLKFLGVLQIWQHCMFAECLEM